MSNRAPSYTGTELDDPAIAAALNVYYDSVKTLPMRAMDALEGVVDALGGPWRAFVEHRGTSYDVTVGRAWRAFTYAQHANALAYADAGGIAVLVPEGEVFGEGYFAGAFAVIFAADRAALETAVAAIGEAEIRYDHPVGRPRALIWAGKDLRAAVGRCVSPA